MKARMLIRRQNGVAAVEMAIVLPVLILLAVGVGEFGVMFYNEQVLVNASREGARGGTVRGSDGSFLLNSNDIKSLVKEYCVDQGRLISFEEGTPDPLTTFPDGDNTGKNFPTEFSVKVTYNHALLIPSLFGLGTTIPLSGETSMTVENWE